MMTDKMHMYLGVSMFFSFLWGVFYGFSMLLAYLQAPFTIMIVSMIVTTGVPFLAVISRKRLLDGIDEAAVLSQMQHLYVGLLSLLSIFINFATGYSLYAIFEALWLSNASVVLFYVCATFIMVLISCVLSAITCSAVESDRCEVE